MKKKTRKSIKEKLLAKYEVLPEEIDPIILKEFKEKCKNLYDSRIKRRCTYKLWDVVIVVFLAVLGKCDEWEEIEVFAKKKYKWLKSFLQLTGGIPKASSYERIIGIIKPQELEDMLTLFVNEVLNLVKPKKDIYNFDGKTDNGSSRKENEIRDKIKALNSLNVYSNNKRMCIASEMIEDKTNEITAMPNILKRINIAGGIATWDAMNTQKDIVELVIKGQADYVGALKGNQGTFFEDVKLYFDDKTLDIIKAKEYGYLSYTEKSHSCVIIYEYFQTEDINWYHDINSWAGLKSIGLVRKTITSYDSKEKKNITTTESRYYISSLNTNIVQFADVIRTHWSVENRLHWHLDYTFNQDKNTTKNKNALFNLQLIKKSCLALLNEAQDIYDCSLKNIRFMLSLDFENEILRFFNILARYSKKTVF